MKAWAVYVETELAMVCWWKHNRWIMEASERYDYVYEAVGLVLDDVDEVGLVDIIEAERLVEEIARRGLMVVVEVREIGLVDAKQWIVEQEYEIPAY